MKKNTSIIFIFKYSALIYVTLLGVTKDSYAALICGGMVSTGARHYLACITSAGSMIMCYCNSDASQCRVPSAWSCGPYSRVINDPKVTDEQEDLSIGALQKGIEQVTNTKK